MDVERTIEFLLEQQAASQARFDAQHAQFRADYEVRQKQYEERQKQYEDRQKQYDERHALEMAQIRQELRRGIRLSVEEARRERVRRQELAAAQALTEQKLQQLIDSLNRPRTNAHDNPS